MFDPRTLDLKSVQSTASTDDSDSHNEDEEINVDGKNILQENSDKYDI